MSARTPSPGALVAGRYRVESVLGQGGIGVVLAVTDEKTNVDCALKLLSAPELGNDRARLIREARALMLITNPHVVRVFDVGDIEDVGPYLVLERLEGEDLGAIAPQGEPLAVELVIDYAAQACEALAAAHALGIIHRDIKPSNLFLAETPQGPLLKVLDFGISKVDGDGQGTLTRDAAPLGTPRFISPEQLADPRTVDARTDIWSLGVVMYRLASGRFPFDGASIVATFAQIGKGEYAPLTGVPASFAAVVARCLALAPAERYASATLLRDALLAADDSAPPASVTRTAITAPGANAAAAPLVAAPVRRIPRQALGMLVFGVAVPFLVAGAWLALRRPPAAEVQLEPVTSAVALPAVDVDVEVDVDASTLSARPPASSAIRRPAPRRPAAPPPKPENLRSNPYR